MNIASCDGDEVVDAKRYQREDDEEDDDDDGNDVVLLHFDGCGMESSVSDVTTRLGWTELSSGGAGRS
jgi:hypothetical protein